MKTAEEFLDPDWSDGDQFNRKEVCKHMIEFARLHVAEARKQFKIVFSEIDDPYPFERNDRLADVYPLSNIK
jgi:hypothetical protein